MIIIKHKKWIVDKKNEDKPVEIIADDENNADGDDKDKKADNNDQSRLVHWNSNLSYNDLHKTNCYTFISICFAHSSKGIFEKIAWPADRTQNHCFISATTV